MGALGEGVFKLGVGSHFGAALGASPVFGSTEKGSAEAVAAVRFHNVPAFDVADGMRWIAAVGVGAQAGFEEAE